MNRIGKVKSNLVGIMVGGGLLAFSPAVDADTVLQMDINSLSATAVSSVMGGVFDTGFSGTVTISDNVNSLLSSIIISIGGIDADQGITSFRPTVSGTITIVAGTVTGGTFSISDGTDIYTADIVSGSGVVTTETGSNGAFGIDGISFNGMFTSNTFAGVDVTDWNGNEPLSGSFLEFKLGVLDTDTDDDGSFDAWSGTLDQSSDLDLFVIVPGPLAAPWGLAGLFGVMAARRRRNKRRVAA